MRLLKILPAALLLMLLVPATNASRPDPRPECQGDIEGIAGNFYLVFAPGSRTELQWIYFENNAIEGLQRGGDAAHGFGHDDCYEQDEVTEEPTGVYDTPVY